MPKRRRERDRPKAAADAPYNPNKRILLSYESDDEKDAEQQSIGSQSPTAPDAATADYKIEEYPDEDEESSTHTQSDEPSGVREDDAEAVQDGLGDGDQAGAPKHDKPTFSRASHKNDATGQWPALGSLSYQWEDEEEEEKKVDDEYDSTEEEAMAYLKSVRSERQSMPEVLHAPHGYTDEEIYESGVGDTRGYIEDGAYVARAISGPSLPVIEKTQVEPQEAFTTALKERFLRHREFIHRTPDADAIAALGDTRPISFPRGNRKAYTDWRRILWTSTPHLAQGRSFEQDVVFRLLELIQKHHLKREKQITTNSSAWIWALLARLDDVGTMDNEQVSAIREFAKKAVLVQLSFNNPTAAEQLERTAAAELYGDAEPTQQPVENGDAAASDSKASMPTLEENVATPHVTNEMQMQNSFATLDMIIVLAGEVFGQRDLLEFRQPWAQAAADVDESS